jgi:uncharacterized protein (DUF39 family)
VNTHELKCRPKLYQQVIELRIELEGHRKSLRVSLDGVYLYVGPATDEGFHAAAQAFVEHLRGVVDRLRETEGS